MNKFSAVMFLFLSSFSFVFTQDLSSSQLEDYTDRAKNQIKIFLENVPIIAGGQQPMFVRKSGIQTTLKIFSKGAEIQEQNKFSKKKTNYGTEKYLNKLLERSESAPVLINFEVIDDLSPTKMKRKKNRDGSISYIGKMIFRQYYCRLKEGSQFREPTRESPNINCAYSDYTDKKVTFELTVRESVVGKFWVTKVSSIEVLRVF